MKRRDCGFTLVELLVVIAILGVLLGLILPAAMRVRDAAARSRCGSNLRQIGLALQMYHDQRGSLPPGMNSAGREFAYLSWSVRIVPYLEQAEVWQRAKDDYASSPDFWRLPHHRGESVVIQAFHCPAASPDIALVEAERNIAFRHYLGVSGQNQRSKDGVLYQDSHVRLLEIRDGTSNTLAVGERPPSADLYFGWWYAGAGQQTDGSADSHLGVREFRTTYRAPTCERGPWHFQAGTQENMCDTFHYWSNHIGGANFLFCDGSVRFLSYSADSILPALATRAGGETVRIPD
jgi:prepilin-type N-terminal cleavage/methylation domain-containing protein/prepilin-type processing-associated H-X9-DG protein